MMRATEEGTYIVDKDIEYFFPNFMLSKEVMPY